MTLLIILTISFLFATPTSAISSITLATTSSEVKLEPAAGTNDITYGNHTLTINATDVLSYNITLKANSVVTSTNDSNNTVNDTNNTVNGATNSNNTANLTNQSNHNATPILPVSGNQPGSNLALGTNQWGYALGSDIPGGEVTEGNKASAIWSTPLVTETTILDKKLNIDGNHQYNDQSDLTIYYGANVDTNTLTKGPYQATVTYTATAIPTATFGPSTDDYGTDGKVQVDYDEHMIPVKYTGNEDKAQWTSLTYQEIADNPKDWYNYPDKQWANAVTVKADKLADYQNKSNVVKEEDVLGYWVYIPRYAYEVMRRDATDKVVQPQDFDIKFETKGDVKKVPATSCNAGIKTLAQMWKNGKADNVESNILAKDYRTGCNLDRTYPGNTIGKSEADRQNNQNSDTTWATHPGFSWCKTVVEDGEKSDCTELNGIWVGKFETTGSTKEPTVLPSTQHISLGDNKNAGDYYDIAKSVGSYDKDNVYGNGSNLGNSVHNLVNVKSHMLKDVEWGAAAYLASSRYGAGVSSVQPNSNWQETLTDGNGVISPSMTGCGPSGNNDPTTYTDSAEGICSLSNSQRSYNGTIGQLASTTNNTYGIYDMAGGAHEMTMGNVSNSVMQSDTDAVTTAIQPPYIDIYPIYVGFGDGSKKPGWTTVGESGNNFCTYTWCGGRARHETKQVQAVTSDHQSWNNNISAFPWIGHAWSDYGGGGLHFKLDPSYTGIFYAASEYGGAGTRGFRVTLIEN